MNGDSRSDVKYGRGQNPRSLANLRPFTAGTRPNPTGRQGPVITPRILRLLAMDPAEFGRLEAKTVADVIAKRYILEAMQSGFDRARQEVIERADGKVKEIIEVNTTEKWEQVQQAGEARLRRVK